MLLPHALISETDFWTSRFSLNRWLSPSILHDEVMLEIYRKILYLYHHLSRTIVSSMVHGKFTVIIPRMKCFQLILGKGNNFICDDRNCCYNWVSWYIWLIARMIKLPSLLESLEPEDGTKACSTTDCSKISAMWWRYASHNMSFCIFCSNRMHAPLLGPMLTAVVSKLMHLNWSKSKTRFDFFIKRRFI